MVKVPAELKDDPVASELRWLMEAGVSTSSCERTPHVCGLPSIQRQLEQRPEFRQEDIAPRLAVSAITDALATVKLPPKKALSLATRRKLFVVGEPQPPSLEERREEISDTEHISVSTLRRREFLLISALMVELGYAAKPALAARGGHALGSETHNLGGTWHALWQTTEQGMEKRNHEVVIITHDGDSLTMENESISSDIRVGGYFWRGELTRRPGNTLVGHYWALDPNANAHGTLFYVINPTGQFMEGIWVGTNIDYPLATGCSALARDAQVTEWCFDRLLDRAREIYSSGRGTL